MGAAKLSDPSALVRSLVRNSPREIVHPLALTWIQRAAQATPNDLWLLDTSWEHIGRFLDGDFGIPIDDELSGLFQSGSGSWTSRLGYYEIMNEDGQYGLFAVPFFGERHQSLGLVTFHEEPKGAAWVRLLGLIFELYLSRGEQARERQMLETLLKQAKDKVQENSEYGGDRAFFCRRRQGSLKELRMQFERMLITDRLSVGKPSKLSVAASLGITYRSLASKCKSLDI